MSAAAVAARSQTGGGEGGLPVAAQFLSGQFVSIATAGRILTGEAIELSNAPPEVIPPADPGEPSAPLPSAPVDPGADSTFEVPVPIILPFAGPLPIDVATLGTCATNFLGRVSDVDVEWPDEMPAFEDYMWTAAAVLLAGGAIYSATGSRNSRPKPRLVAVGSGLAEWEGKNVGRPD